MMMTTAPTSQTMLFIFTLRVVPLEKRKPAAKVPPPSAGTFGRSGGSAEVRGLSDDATAKDIS
ncbi:hypothetical protein ACQKGC_07065 [Allorhizobium pseudoryzae]|uniref:hypothetical protein n=1 Tax=Allorhizobium pseudoryzae TaxID=379684 RepID=UPI0013EB9C1E|nr:hypothetical protein [Allorhizobium pseudoryzae]